MVYIFKASQPRGQASGSRAYGSFESILLVFPNAAFEFICAQSPYNMRGLLIGMFYALQGIANGITALILLVFGTSFSSQAGKTTRGLFGCEF